MKAIANSIEPTAAEPGFLARAVRPVAGFGFEHLFTMTDAVVSKDGVVVDPELSGEFLVDTPTLPPFEPTQIDTGQMAVVSSVLEARFTIDAGFSQDDVSDGIDLPLALDPGQAEPMVGHPMRPPWLSATQPHIGHEVMAAPLALPPAFDPLSKKAALPADAVPLNSLTDASGLEGPNAVALGIQEPPKPSPASFVMVDGPAVDDDATAARKGPGPELADTVVGTRQPLAKVGAPIEAPEALQPMQDGALKPQDHKAISDPATWRIAPAGSVEGEEALAEAPQNARLWHDREGGAKNTISAPIQTQQTTPSATAAGKGEAPPVLVVPISLSPSPPPATATPSANPMMAAVVVDGPNAERRDAQMLPKAKTDVEARIAMRRGALKQETVQDAAGRAEPFRSEVAQSVIERVDPMLAAPAVARSTVSGGAATQQVAPALPPAVALNLRQADWGKQFISQIERMVTDGLQRIEVSLRPKNLGEVQVVLDLRGDQATVHLACETAAAVRLLLGAEDKLAQVLDQSGYRLSGFSAQENGAGAQTGQQGQQSPRRSRAAVDPGKREDPSDAAATSPYSADRGRSNGINVLA